MNRWANAPRRGMRMAATLAAVAVLAVACVTVNIYFPAAKVEKAAEQIVDDIYGTVQDKNAAPAPADPSKPEKRSGLETLLALADALGPAPAFAEDAASVSNAAIRGLKDQIGQGLQQLAPFFASGKAGLGKDGLLAVLDTAGLAMPQVAQLKQLVAANNAARTRLFQEVAAAMNLAPAQAGQVQSVFAKVFRDKLPAGWAYQTDGGSWAKK